MKLVKNEWSCKITQEFVRSYRLRLQTNLAILNQRII